MSFVRQIPLWLVLAGSPATVLAAQIEAASEPGPRDASYSCADTSIRRWLPSDTGAGRSQVDARALYEHHLATTYAPILRFAPSERYFPTIPYWTAFRGKAPAMPPLSEKFAEAADGSEIPLPLISAVRAAYDSAVDLSLPPYRLRVPLPVVFYRVCDFTDPTSGDTSKAGRERAWERKADHLWSYLRSDEQAWHRFGLRSARTSDTTLSADMVAAALGGRRIRDIKRFHVIQYFVYYLQDWGLQGHSEDIEFAFVILPVDTTMAKSFRIIVGAGHDPPAPNNVLVLVGRDASKRRYYHPNILVELGGHSSAPDMPPFGQFSAGLDVNWHIDDLWGTRDEQATAGVSFAGRYEGTMTYPRDPEGAVTMFPRGFGAGSDSMRQVLADLVRVSPDYLAARAHEAGHEAQRRGNFPSAERRRLAEAILAAYRTVRAETEAPRREAIGRSPAVQTVEENYPNQTEAQYREKIEKALRQDSVALEDTLQGIARTRHRGFADTVASLLRRARCPEAPEDALEGGKPAVCPPWLTEDSMRKVGDSVVRMVEQRSRRIPAESLMVQLLKQLPDPDVSKSPLDAIATEIRDVVTERMQPEYTLVPVRYLQALYQGADSYNTAQVERHLKLITRLLHPATCEELACDLHLRHGERFDAEFRQVVCGPEKGRTKIPGSVDWPESLACTFDSTRHMEAIRLWNYPVYDQRRDAFGGSREWPAHKHKIWEHGLYRRPEMVFRTWLFRPTWLQVKNSRSSFRGLFHAGNTFYFGRASNPYIGFVIPAFRAGVFPVRIPGYLALQVGPYIGQPWRSTKATWAAGLLYDRQFAYFYGLHFKAHWAKRRSEVEGNSGASEFSWTFGASLWCPCFRPLHVRPGFRFDTDAARPLFGRTAWELQIEYRR